MCINNVTNRNIFRKHSAFTAGLHELSWFEICISRKKPHLHKPAVQRARGANDTPITARVIHSGSDFAIGITQKNDLGTRKGDLNDAAHEEALRGQDGQIGSDPISRTQIDSDGTPPVSWLA